MIFNAGIRLGSSSQYIYCHKVMLDSENFEDVIDHGDAPRRKGIVLLVMIYKINVLD
jgi:hypothetical protein